MLNRCVKILTIFAILLMLLSILTSVFAVTDDDINIIDSMLENTVSPTTADNTVRFENEISTNTNDFRNTNVSSNTSTNVSSNTSTNTNTSNSIRNTSSGDEIEENATSYDNYTGVPDTSTTVSSYVPESGLDLSNILNILLVVVGVLLILLAIAILIKLKK